MNKQEVINVMQELGQQARLASRRIAGATRGEKDAALLAIANELEAY